MAHLIQSVRVRSVQASEVQSGRAPARVLTLLASISISSLAAPAFAQEAMYTEAATMPSPGTYVLRQQITYFKYGLHPHRGSESTEETVFENSLTAGLARAFSLRLTVPAAWRREEPGPDYPSGEDGRDQGVENLDLMFKWRVYQSDTTGIDTLRAALLFGASVPSGDDHDFSTGSVNPAIGAVLTRVWGRHGFNQDFIYRFNTGGDFASNMGGDGPDDALKFDTAYLFRIAPTEYTEHTTGAWYATAEINGLYETGGDTELRFSPGFMYEGREFVFQIMTQFPLWHDLEDRGELDVAIGVGVRFLF
jgi:hypothetical protein